VPVESLVRKFEHVRFEPSGMTRNPEIPIAKSLVDYIFRWLAMEFVPGYRAQHAPRRTKPAIAPAPALESTPPVSPLTADEPEPTDLSDIRPTPTAEKKSGNGHGPRIDIDTAKPFNYGTATDEQLKEAHSSHLQAPEVGAPNPSAANLRLAIVSDPLSQQGSELQADAPACDVCGSITVRSGTCYKCLNCGNSMGCS
jgi:ribonucleoside-diphosphate reductase alpha chain